MRLNDHLEKIPYFLAIARLGSFQAATQELYLTQPSLSKSMKILEDCLETKLFHRHSKGVTLTPEGEILYREGLKLIQQADGISRELANPGDPFADTLRIGTYDSMLIYFWANFLKKFSRRHPALRFEIKTMRSRDVQKAIEEDELDFAFIISPKQSNNLEVIKLEQDNFYFFESTQKNKSYDSLSSAPIIFMEQSFSTIKDDFEAIKSSLNRDKLQPRKAYSVSSLESVKELCLNGLGVGILPCFVAAQELKAKRLKIVPLSGTKIDKGFGQHDLSIVFKKQWKNSPTIQDLIAQMQAHIWNFETK
jgi:DNA-binding transcriptional LysR family regulator